MFQSVLYENDPFLWVKQKVLYMIISVVDNSSILYFIHTFWWAIDSILYILKSVERYYRTRFNIFYPISKSGLPGRMFVHLSTSVHIFKFLMVHRPNPSMFVHGPCSSAVHLRPFITNDHGPDKRHISIHICNISMI